jgi:hypothetical protein
MQSVTPPEKYRLLAERNNLLCLKQKKILFTLSILRLLVFAGGAGLAIAGFRSAWPQELFPLFLHLSYSFFYLTGMRFIRREKSFSLTLKL